MPKATNVVRLELPKTSAQARRIQRLRRKEQLIDVEVTVLEDDDEFREQRTWRILFGLYQDCACVPWSKGFKKTPGFPFSGKMRSSNLVLFLREAVPMVVLGRAEIRVNGERIRRRLLDVMAA